VRNIREVEAGTISLITGSRASWDILLSVVVVIALGRIRENMLAG
jgi:hypothetical protein